MEDMEKKVNENKIETEPEKTEKSIPGKLNFFDKMDRIMDSRIFKIAAAIIFIIGGYLFYRYGWKYMGFQMTTDPNYISVFSVGENKKENHVWVTGKTYMNIGSFAGYISEYDEVTKTLYLGIRFHLSGDNTEFRIFYPETKHKVDKIVLRKNDIKTVIWERGEGE